MSRRGTRAALSMAMTAAVTLASGPCAVAAAGGQAQDAAVSSQVVPGDPYPQRRIEFAQGVTGLPDLTYSTVPGFRPLRLDLYLPPAKRRAGPSPFVIYVHGGGWQGGHTRQSGAFESWPKVLASLAARGYVVASIEYRLSGEARFPAAEQDVKAAIRWMRSQASTYGIDRNHGLIWGASAGGQLAALAATSCGVAALEPPPQERPGTGPTTDSNAAALESDCVQGAVTWYGVFDFSRLGAQSASGAAESRDRADPAAARYLGCQLTSCPRAVVEAASPITYVDRSDPPMLLIHGESDRTVPVRQSQEMYARLRQTGVHAELLVIPGVDHSFIGATPAATRAASRAALERVFTFIDATIGHQTPSSPGAGQ